MPLRDDIVVAPYDFADYIATAEDARVTIATAFEDGDPAIINRAIGAVARSKGMTALALETGLTRDALYKGLAPDGNPSLRTVLKVLNVIGLGLRPVVLTAARMSAEQAHATVAKVAAGGARAVRSRVEIGGAMPAMAHARPVMAKAAAAKATPTKRAAAKTPRPKMPASGTEAAPLKISKPEGKPVSAQSQARSAIKPTSPRSARRPPVQ